MGSYCCILIRNNLQMEITSENIAEQEEESNESSAEWTNSLDSDGLPPADPRLVDKLIYQLKSKGMFDQIREECLSEVNSLPAYKNLTNRISEASKQFLGPQKWNPGLNRNQVRNQLKKHIQMTPIFEDGIDQIVEQVVTPKISSVIKPEVEKLINFIINPDQQKEEESIETKIRAKENVDFNNNYKKDISNQSHQKIPQSTKVKKLSEFEELLKKSQEMMQNP